MLQVADAHTSYAQGFDLNAAWVLPSICNLMSSGQHVYLQILLAVVMHLP